MANRFPEAERPEDEPPSKSERKREALSLQALGKSLVELSDAALAGMPLTEDFRGHVVAARTMRRGALKRQLKFLGARLGAEDVDAIRSALERQRTAHGANVLAFKTLEHWRDRLIDGDDAVLEDIAQRLDGVDRQHLRTLARNARRERDRAQPPRAARSLFRYLASLPSVEGS